MTSKHNHGSKYSSTTKVAGSIDADLTKAIADHEAKYHAPPVVVPPPVIVPPPQPSGFPPEETLKLLPAPTLPPLPPLRTPTVIDDRKYTRVGNAGVYQAYSKQQPWSLGDKWLHLHYGGHWLFDGQTLAPIKQISPPDRAQWSATDPDVIYGTSAKSGGQQSQMASLNVVSGLWATLYDFGRTVSLGNGEGAISDAGVVALQDSAGNACTFDTQTRQATPWFPIGGVPDSVTMSHDGEWIVVVHGSGDTGSGTPGRGTWAYRKDGSAGRQLRPWANHADTAISSDGRQVLVAISPYCEMIDLATGAVVRLLDSPNAYEYGHVSGRGPAGWATLSNYQLVERPGKDQVVMVKLDGSKLVRRYGFAFHRGTGYDLEPHSVPNRDGKRVLSVCDFGTGSPYAFVAEA